MHRLVISRPAARSDEHRRPRPRAAPGCRHGGSARGRRCRGAHAAGGDRRSRRASSSRAACGCATRRSTASRARAFGAEDEQLDLRSTLFAEYDTGVVRIGAELYDSRAWLTEAGQRDQRQRGQHLRAGAGLSRGRLRRRRSARAARRACRPGASRSTSARAGWSRPTTTATPPTATPGCAPTCGPPAGSPRRRSTSCRKSACPTTCPRCSTTRPQWDRESFDLQLWGGYRRAAEHDRRRDGRARLLRPARARLGPAARRATATSTASARG